MDIQKLKDLAGVPYTYTTKAVVKEAVNPERSICRTISNLIKELDLEVSTTENREFKSHLNDTASDLEIILQVVKSGKQTKANKLYNELSKPGIEFIKSKINPNKLKEFQEYFNIISESDNITDVVPEDIIIKPESIEDKSVEDTDDSPKPDIVICPFCEQETKISKSDFYDHIMDNHVECDEEPKVDNSDQEDIEDVANAINDIMDKDVELKEAVVDATVWDKTEDKDESPSAYPKDLDKIKLPKDIKKQLMDEIKELQEESDKLLITDYLTAEFYNDTANAMIDVLNHLSQENEHGMKMAQVCITKFMSPIVQKFPKDVYDFIVHGGYDTKKDTKNGLVSMFKEINYKEIK